MAGIDDVLERLITDDAFRVLLANDPDRALTGYDLTDDDRALLTSQVSSDAGRAGTLEGRTSKAGLFGLLGGLDEIADAVAGADPTPAASGGTMSTDTWDEPTAVGETPGETITIHGPYDLPNTVEPDQAAVPAPAAGANPRSHGGEIDVQSVDWGDGQPTAGDEHEIEMAVEAGESDEPPQRDEIAPTSGMPSGFDPDHATTMTAIALAESGGSTTEPAGEDSRGLWQINVDPAAAPDDQHEIEKAVEPGATDEPPADHAREDSMPYSNAFEVIPSAMPAADPDQFDTSELVQWSAAHTAAEPNPADLSATPDAASEPAGQADGAAEPPTPDR